jgi:hypothetical protein
MVGGLGMGRPLVQDGTALDFVGLPLHPRMHIISDGHPTFVRLTSVPRGILLQLLGREPSGIQRDGVSLNKVAAVDVFETADTGWRYDTAGRFTYVKFTHPGGSANVVVQH